MVVLSFKKYADLQDHGSWTMPEAAKAIVEENLEGRKSKSQQASTDEILSSKGYPIA